VRRRLELRGSPRGIHVYDDFAHHPTAIRLTLEGLRRRVGGARIMAALDLASNTMRQGVHANALAEALAGADRVVLHAAGELDWDPAALAERLGRERAVVLRDAAAVAETLAVDAEPGDHVVVMSNSGFGGLPGRLVQWLDNAADGTNDAT
jgi:UDP-N-acetylmuramate: L-alanyl-gamma-D-glutamyl-meso-diaminopimelate ligase